jgi:hypothetical protein
MPREEGMPRYMMPGDARIVFDCGESTIEAWVAMGKFPAPKRIGPYGMRRWSWREVERHIEGPPQDNDDVNISERIRKATEAASERTERDGLEEEAIKEAEARHAAKVARKCMRQLDEKGNSEG